MVYKRQPPDELDIKILECVQNSPGCGIGDVIRETTDFGVQNITIRYRVKKLAEDGYIKLDKVLNRFYILYPTEKAAEVAA